MPRKVLFDCDPGVDDSIAILFGLRSPELEFVGFTTVFGNTDVENTAQNALRLVELAGKPEIPVARGAGQPYSPFKQPFYGREVHGEDGLGNTHMPAPRGKLQPVAAAQFLVDTIMANPGEITLAAVGPLTNLALALRLEPRIVQAVKDVIVMGGAAFCPGNVSAVSEANISNDPLAANMVFRAGWPLTMVGLDVTHKTRMTRDWLEGIFQTGTPVTDFLSKILPCYQKFHDDLHQMGGDVHTHDPSAVGFMVDPGLFVTRRVPVYVETEGHCAGFTVPDVRHQWADSVEIDVCVDVHSPALLDLMRARLVQR
jgi:uridine nucleosidase